MSYEFVNVTSQQPRHDEATSTRIRAQVMRNFRRRELERKRRSEQSSSRPSTHATEDLQGELSGYDSSSSGELVVDLSRSEVLDMQTAIHAYHSWLATYPNSEDMTDTIANAAWRFSGLPIVLYAQCLESVAHLESIDQSQIAFTDLQKTRIKVSLLRLAHESIKTQGTSLRDEIVAALACLTTYELSKQSNEASIHLHGLADCLSLRSVDHPPFMPDTVTFLQMADVLRAITFQSQPLYTSTSNYPWTAVALEGDGFGSQRGPRSPSSSPLAESLSQSFASWHSALLQATISASSSAQQSALVRMGTLAAHIHIAATRTVPIHANTMREHCEALYQSISTAPDALWLNHTALHIRILLTASHFCNSRQPWYFAHLNRALYNVPLEYWRGVKGIMLEFIAMRGFQDPSFAGM